MRKGKQNVSLLFILIISILFISSPIQAQAADWFKFTGKPQLIKEPKPYHTGDKFAEKVNFTPKLTKNNKTGVYTLTMYDRSVIKLNVSSSNAAYRAVRVKTLDSSSINAFGITEDGSVEISTNGVTFEEGKSKYTETVKLRLQDCRTWLDWDKGIRNKNYGKYYGTTVTLKVVVKKLPLTLDEQYTAQANERLQEVLKEINASQYETEVKKAGAIFEWVVANVEGNMDYHGKDWRAALNEGYAVCAGVSELFKILCNEEGLLCETVANVYHQWNIIMIDNKWYWADTTDATVLYFDAIADCREDREDVIAMKECIKKYGGEMATEYISWIDE